MRLRKGALACGLCVALAATGAAAEGGKGQLGVEVVPGLGTGSLTSHAWTAVVVRLHNGGSQPARGTVELRAQSYGSGSDAAFRASAPYALGAGATVHLRLPAYAESYADVVVEVRGVEGALLDRTEVSVAEQSRSLLVDVTETSRLKAVLADVTVHPSYEPSRSHTRGAPSTSLGVAAPRFDPATGEPILPDRAPLYASADAVLVPSDTLSRLTGAELDALAGWVLAGGSLAVSVRRPEDLRHPTLVALAGGPISAVAVAPETLVPLSLERASSQKAKPTIVTPAPSDALKATLSGYAGGNLQPSLYGASAMYGLGELHLFAFDPASKAALEDPWAQARVADVARRGFDRRSSLVFRPGSTPSSANNGPVRQQLDPNQSSRWAIGVATLLLCFYAIFAGPVSFTLAARRGQPLRALWRLPIYAAVTFLVIVGIGVSAKGLTGRARHLSLIEAGAGMPRGAVRRFRGFFTPRAQELTVRTTDASSVLATAVVDDPSARNDHLLVDREGARLVALQALPWQTVVVREDGLAPLGDGISIVAGASGGLDVTNRTGRPLRGVLVRNEKGETFYAARLADGDRLSTLAATNVTTLPGGTSWKGSVATTTSVGRLDVHELAAHELTAMLAPDAPGLAEAWAALEGAAGQGVDWFPDGVPVVLAQLDGGAGRTSDAGLPIEQDRLLVRVVGYGGRP